MGVHRVGPWKQPGGILDVTLHKYLCNIKPIAKQLLSDTIFRLVDTLRFKSQPGHGRDNATGLRSGETDSCSVTGKRAHVCCLCGHVCPLPGPSLKVFGKSLLM